MERHGQRREHVLADGLVVVLQVDKQGLLVAQVVVVFQLVVQLVGEELVGSLIALVSLILRCWIRRICT